MLPDPYPSSSQRQHTMEKETPRLPTDGAYVSPGAETWEAAFRGLNFPLLIRAKVALGVRRFPPCRTASRLALFGDTYDTGILQKDGKAKCVLVQGGT